MSLGAVLRAVDGGLANTLPDRENAAGGVKRGKNSVTNSNIFTGKVRLLATAAPFAMILGATPAFAQDAPTTVAAAPQAQAVATESADDKANAAGDIVVTGTLFRRTDTATPSPVTVLTSKALEERGINTVSEAIQRLSANGSGTLPNSFSANGAFASGASAPALRGLTTDSTLVLFDGLRAAYYPLADDGTRNFVDINSIPDAIVDRVEVLKDGASSTYGADAIAGVVNIITKKQITGLHLNASSGISEHGDDAEQRIDATFGYGDLADQGFNVYVSGEYQKDDILYSHDRGYPYNTNDLSKLCGTSVGTATIPAGTTTCRSNGIIWGTQADGTIVTGTTMVPLVRAYNAANSAAIVGSQYSILNPALGCQGLQPVTLTAAQSTSLIAAGATVPTYASSQCRQDSRAMFSVILPEQQRIGASARATVNLSDTWQAYGQFNFYQSQVFYTGTPGLIRANTPAGGVAGTTASIALPVYVCPRNGASATFVNSVPTTPGCTAANGTLNPNNPFAAQGQNARILYQLSDIPLSNERLTNSYRAAGGITGSVGGFDIRLDGTYMKQDLKATYKGYFYFQHLFDVIADGSYNFVNPALNTQATRDYLAPTVVNNSSSELDQVQLSVSKDLFTLPGGPLQVAVGGSYRHESVNAPSANPVNAASPYLRYVTINGFGTSGSRNVKSAFFEINAPLFSVLEINGSGRYDDYSSGQSNFSPKIGAKFTPIKQIAFTSTFSKGFRIPSFAEAYGLPTTGYITQTPPSIYQNSAACQNPANPGTKFAYCTATYSLGLTSVGNPNLKPEKATNFTVGVIVEPTRNLSFSVDYYNIYKKDLITGANYAPQIDAYYSSATSAGTTLTNGITGITQDPNYLAANGGPYPLLSTIQYGFINADSFKSTGLDFDFEGKFNITPSLKWSTSLDATYVIELSQTIDGQKQNYAGTLGAYQTTSASGTPRWRGSWQNTLELNKVSLTATAYYTSGYELGAEDDGNVTGVCAAKGSYAIYRDGATVVACKTKSFINVDLTASVKINEKFTLYTNVLNLLKANPPYDPSTYGAYQYNPAWANEGIVGRYFRVGAKVNF
jgi:iron complex outermembrane receptor protein